MQPKFMELECKGNAGRAVTILPAKFLEKQEAKSNEQNAGKIGENLEKWVSENCNLAYFALQRWRHLNRIVINRIRSPLCPCENS